MHKIVRIVGIIRIAGIIWGRVLCEEIWYEQEAYEYQAFEKTVDAVNVKQLLDKITV